MKAKTVIAVAETVVAVTETVIDVTKTVLTGIRMITEVLEESKK